MYVCMYVCMYVNQFLIVWHGCHCDRVDHFYHFLLFVSFLTCLLIMFIMFYHILSLLSCFLMLIIFCHALSFFIFTSPGNVGRFEASPPTPPHSPPRPESGIAWHVGVQVQETFHSVRV